MDHEYFMRIALGLSRKTAANGNMPCGSLIVRDGEIVAEGANTVNSDTDPTAHAEVMALRAAATRLGSVDLSGCTLYTTMEPCPMCCWAILVSRIESLVLGGRHDPVLRPELGTYTVEALLKMTGRPLRLVTGVLQREGADPLRAWLADHKPQGIGSRP
jgi:tRNA(Arg) A34 adenosine deaminase TadA